jgi:hypothetical protein
VVVARLELRLINWIGEADEVDSELSNPGLGLKTAMLDGDTGEKVEAGAGLSEVPAISELDTGVEALLGSKTSDRVAVVVERRNPKSPGAEVKAGGRDDTCAGPAEEPGRTELESRTFTIVVDSGA